MLLSGCANSTPPTLIYVTPPTAYVQPCERSQFKGKTYGDAVVYLRMLMKERDACANRIDKVREWIVEQAQR